MSVPPTTSNAATTGINARTSMFCRSESPDVVRWFLEHDPDPKVAATATNVNNNANAAIPTPIPVHQMHGSQQGNTVKSSGPAPSPSPSPGSRMYDAEEEARCREALKLLDATELPSEAALELIEEAHTVEYSRTLVCNAPKEELWKVMLDRVRRPQLYYQCSEKKIKILCECVDTVFREMWVGPEFKEHLKEKITWDEESETVRFELYDDPSKEGWIENAITTDASGHVCLTVSCHWTFFPVDGKLTVQGLKQWRQGLRKGLDAGCAGTVAIVEEQAAQQREAAEREAKASASGKKEEKENKSNSASDSKKGSPRVIQVAGKEM